MTMFVACGYVAVSSRADWRVLGPSKLVAPLSGDWKDVVLEDGGTAVAQLSTDISDTPMPVALLRYEPLTAGTVEVRVHLSQGESPEGGGILLKDESAGTSFYVWLGRRVHWSILGGPENLARSHGVDMMLETYYQCGPDARFERKELIVLRQPFGEWNKLGLEFKDGELILSLNDRLAAISSDLIVTGPVRVGLFCFPGVTAAFQVENVIGRTE
jgi:hypothetical protein